VDDDIGWLTGWGGLLLGALVVGLLGKLVELLTVAVRRRRS
jgi:hypothetical protein